METKRAIAKIRAFNRFYTNVIGVVNRHILDSPYSLTEVRIMFEINHDPDSTARKIKNFLHVDEGYLSRTVDKLVNRGLVKRKQSPRDARQFVLSLTAKGKREFLELNRRSGAAVASMVGHLSPAELDDLVFMLHRIQLLLSTENKHARQTGRHPHAK